MDNFTIPKHKVYIKIDENNRVVDINSSVFITDLTDWLWIDEGYGDKYAHAQSSYLDKPLIDNDGTHNYFYTEESEVNGEEKTIYNRELRYTTDAEKAEEKSSFPEPEPTLEEKFLAYQIENDGLIAELMFGGDI